MNRPPLFALLECLHARTTTSAVHQRSDRGGSCNHDETCDDCGCLVGTESWNLAIGAAAHAKRYQGAA